MYCNVLTGIEQPITLDTSNAKERSPTISPTSDRPYKPPVKVIMNPVYTRQQLESKKLVELKAIATTLGVIATDKRIKASWVEAILSVQPVKVEPSSPKLEVIDETAVDASGKVVAAIACDDNLTQPWFVLVGASEIHRANTWAKCFEYVRRNYKNGTLPQVEEQVDDYLFHYEQPVNLPKQGDIYFVGSFLLRCVIVGGEYATTWDVCDGNQRLGEIKMSWNCVWYHTMSFATFTTPQKAVADLFNSLQELVAV